MRKEFFEINRYEQGNHQKMIKETAAWAAKIVKVEGGYMAFESIDDFTTWKNQK